VVITSGVKCLLRFARFPEPGYARRACAPGCAGAPGLAPEAAAYLNTRRTVWCAMLGAVALVVVGNVPGTLWTLL